MWRNKKVVCALALSILVAVPFLAYVVKGQKGNLGALTFARPELRVSVTATDSEPLRTLLPNAKALDLFRAENGAAWSFVIDERSGRLNLLDGGAIPFIPGPANTLSAESFGVSGRSAQDVPVEKVEALARDFLKRYYDVFQVNPDELVLDPSGSGPIWDSIYFLRFQWTPQGVPVEGGSVFFRINNGNLIQVAMENISGAPVDAVPTLSAETAWEILLGYLGAPLGKGDEVLDRGTLRLIPVTAAGFAADSYDRSAFGQMLNYRLTYRLAFRRPGVQGTWEAIVDAHTGELLRFVDANRYGHIHGGIRPSDGLPPEEDRPFPYADIGGGLYADGNGNFTGNSATTTLTGKYTHIGDACGPISAATTTGDIDFGSGPTGSDCAVPTGNTYGAGNTKPSRTLYYNCTAINLKAQIYNPSNTWLTSTYVTCNVNGSPTCNASSGGGVINFYKLVAGSCNNLGEIPGVAMHEWAHSFDDQDGSGGQTLPVETYADWTAIIQTHNSCTGAGFLIGANCGGYGDACTGCTGVRDCDWAKHSHNTPWTSANNGSVYNCSAGSYDGPCGWEDHCESGIATQALWDFVYRDLTDTSASGPMYPNALDITTAWMLEDRLWFTGVQTLTAMYTCSAGVTNGCSGTVLYSVMRALDDDGDGTANGTPHAHAIYHAMARHNMQCNTWNDTSPQNQNQTSCPALTTPTLSATAGNNQVILNWTTGGANATRYLVYKNESGCDVAYNRIAIVTAPTLTYTDNACVNGITYYYRVQAAAASDSCVSPSSTCTTVTPQPCAASVSMDRGLYNCSDTVNISVLDSTPGTAPWVAEAWSTTDGTHKTLTLVNNPSGSATYTGSFTTTSGAAGATQVRVADGATLTVQFTDPDYCGAGSHSVTATASVDCVGPVISNVAVTNVTGNGALVTWTTNENANSRVTYGTAVPPGTNQDDLSHYVTSHSVQLTGLAECTDYVFSVTSADVAANSATDNHSGAYYTFTTGKNTQPTYTKVESPPLAIPDNDATGASSVLAVTDTKTVQKVVVTVNSITHTYDGDIALYLIGPDATQVTLSNGHGGSGDNYTNTVFDDAAATAIASGSAPFTGTFIPDGALSAFNGKSALGNWTLKVVDSAGLDTGTIDSWSLTLTYPAAACGPHGKYSAHARVADTCASGGTGNSNTYWDPGEQVQFSVTLENDGTVPLTGVSAVVTSSTPGVTLVNGSASYGDIAIGATGVSLAPHFTVQLPPSLSCGDSVNFHIALTSAQGTWGSDFSQIVGHVVAGGNITVFSENFNTVTPPALPTGWTYGHTGAGNDWLSSTSYYCSGPNSLLYPYNSTAAANAWAFTPGIALTAGVTYTLSFNQRVASSTWTEIFEVKCGTAATPAGQTITILASANYTNTTCGVLAPTFTVPATGTYYIGYHCTSAADQFDLVVDDIALTYSQAPSCTAYTCGPNVAYDGSLNPLGTLVEVCGDHDSVVEPGEQWQVTVRLKNTGSQSATAVQADLAVNSGSAAAASITGNPGSFGTIAVGGTATATYEFTPDSAVACNKDLVFDMTGVQSAEASYPTQTAAFAVQVGGNTSAKDETATQVTTPLTASGNTAHSSLTPALTVTAPATATLSYSSAYTPPAGVPVTLFGPDDLANLNNWTASGYAANNANTCSGHSGAAVRSTNSAGTYTFTKTAAVSTVGYSNITVGMDWRVTSATNATQYLDWSTDGTNWTLGAASTTSATVLCGQSVTLPSGAAGQGTLYIRFRTVATGAGRGIVDYITIGGTPPGSGSWTANARVSLVSPTSAAIVLKAYGAADANPYDVLSYYTGPGTYQVRLEESTGGTASLTSGSLHVTQSSTTHCTVASCGTPSETAPGDLLGTAQTWTDKTTHTWPSNPQATGYKVVLGTPAQLPNLLNASTDSCVKWTGVGTNCTLSDTPAEGSFYWYLVIGTNGAGDGSPGNATAGPRVLNSTTGTCP